MQVCFKCCLQYRYAITICLFLYIGGIALLYRVWDTNGGSFFLLSELTFTLVSATAPLIAKPFLSGQDRTGDFRNTSHTYAPVSVAMTYSQQLLRNTSDNLAECASSNNGNEFGRNFTDLNQLVTGIHQKNDIKDWEELNTYAVKTLGLMLHRGTLFPYSISAIVHLVIGLFICVIYLCTKSTNANPIDLHIYQNSDIPKRNTPLLVLLMILFCLSAGIDMCFFILTFLYVRDVLTWSVSHAVYASATYFIGLSSGRAIGIPIIRWLSPEVYMGACVLITYCTLTVLFIIGNPSQELVLVSIVAIGISMAVKYPGVFAIGHKHMRMSTSTSGFLTFSRFLGGLILPTLANYYLSQFVLINWLAVNFLLLSYILIMAIVKVNHT